MATKLISISSEGVNETVASGDKLIIRARHTAGEQDISLSVFPAAGATARIFTTHAFMSKIAANPDDANIHWLSWANGDVTNASSDAEKQDTFLGRIKAIKIEAIGGAVTVEASV